MAFLFCSQFGFSLGRTLIDAINPYVHNHLDGCLLQNISNLKTEQKDDSSIIYFTMDLKNLTYVYYTFKCVNSFLYNVLPIMCYFYTENYESTYIYEDVLLHTLKCNHEKVTKKMTGDL